MKEMAIGYVLVVFSHNSPIGVFQQGTDAVKAYKRAEEYYFSDIVIKTMPVTLKILMELKRKHIIGSY